VVVVVATPAELLAREAQAVAGLAWLVRAELLRREQQTEVAVAAVAQIVEMGALVALVLLSCLSQPQITLAQQQALQQSQQAAQTQF
jgi:hypothetical protein